MNGYRSVCLMLLSALALSIIIVKAVFGSPLINAAPMPPFDFPLRDILETYILIKTIITSINLILLLFVFVIYIRIYNTTGSKFSLGLVFLTIALMLYAITSNPILHVFTGVRVISLGVFTMLPDLFTLIASAILLYLSRQ